MFSRVVMISGFLGSGVFFLDGLARMGNAVYWLFFGLVAGTYLLTLVYAGALRSARALKPLAYVQIAGDIVISTALVWATGGSESIFTFLFSLVIISAAIILFRTGAFVTATATSLLFLGLLALESSPWRDAWPGWGHFHPDPNRNVYYVAFIHVASFYLVGILSGYLAEMLRRAGSRIREQSFDLKRLQALYERIVHAMSGGLITVDGQRIIYLNPSAERITGLDARAVLGEVVTDVFPGIDLSPAPPPSEPPVSRERRQTPVPGVDRVAAEGGALPRELTFEPRDREAIRLAYRSSLLPLPGEPEPGRLVVFEDVTRLRELEAAIHRSERLAVVGELAAGIAHELRNPLASISGAVQLLSRGDGLDPEDRTLMDIVRQESERLERLITDFLLYARPSLRAQSPVCLSELVRMTQMVFDQDTSTASGTHCVVDCADDHWVSGDSDQLQQVLWNLLTNAAHAVEACEDRAITVRVRSVAAAAADSHDWVELTVQDRGPGIPDHLQGRIFDPFFTTRPRGTGLGLAIVHRIVEEHGGTLALASAPDRGTRVAVLLPAATQTSGRWRREQPA